MGTSEKINPPPLINTFNSGLFCLAQSNQLCLIKAAVKSLSESLRYDIGVTSIHPGNVRTNILHAGR